MLIEVRGVPRAAEHEFFDELFAALKSHRGTWDFQKTIVGGAPPSQVIKLAVGIGVLLTVVLEVANFSRIVAVLPTNADNMGL